MPRAHTGDLVCVAQIGAAHGVRGEVRLRSFTQDPLAIVQYGTLQTEDGRNVRIETARPAKDVLVARLAGIADRNAAEGLRNLKLYVPRARLPAIEEAETYYHADLIGFAVVGTDGATLGRLTAIHDFGAGDLLELTPEDGGPSVLLPFTKAVVPVIDMPGRHIVAEPPEGMYPPLQGEGRPTERSEGGRGGAKPHTQHVRRHTPTRPLRGRPPPSRGR